MDEDRALREGAVSLPELVYFEGYNLALALKSVGRGWAGLVREAFALIEQYAPSLKVVQVKQRYRRLVLATRSPESSIPPELGRGLERIEDRSLETCEACGALGAPDEDDGLWPALSWLFTLCPTCRARRQAGARTLEEMARRDDTPPDGTPPGSAG